MNTVLLIATSLLRAAAAMKVVQDAVQRPPPPTPVPTPLPTTEPPTPAPTTLDLLPGVACPCLPPTCFAAYDLNNDSCLSQDECDLQVTLLGNCTGVATYGPAVWDSDEDGCINYTEWQDIFAATNGSVCPVEVPEIPDECDPGYYLVANPTECQECIGGEVRRRRALECTPCPAGFVDLNCGDDCVDMSATLVAPSSDCARNTDNNTCNIPVLPGTPGFCDEYAVGDNVTIRGTDPDCVSGEDCLEIFHCVLTAMTQVIGTWEYFIECPSFQYTITVNETRRLESRVTEDRLAVCIPPAIPANSNMYLTCTVTDGTDLSDHFSPSSSGCVCACGDVLCSSTEICTENNGTGVCTRAGPYPEFSTPAPTVGAKGDPHLVNLQGEHFDINHEGNFELIRFPQAADMPVELSFLATVQPDHGKPCTTYITQVEVSGAWLGSKGLQIRCYRKSHSNDTDAFLGARLLEGGIDPPWQTIQEFGSERIVLSKSGSNYEVILDKATWSPKKRTAVGPTAAGMFTLSLRNRKSAHAAKITVRQDLPEQEHLNVAVRRLSQLGRVDIGGLLGFDQHPDSLERPSAACVHHRATARYRIESQDEDHGYYYRPAWKDRWDQIRRGRSEHEDNEASAFLLGRADSRVAGSMCKCQSGSSPNTIEGVLVEEASNMFAEASWD